MKRDIGKELIWAIDAVKTGQGKRKTVVLPSNVKTIRSKTGLSQSALPA